MSKDLNNEVFEKLKAELLKKFDVTKVESLLSKHANSFSEDYFIDYSAEEIAHDIEVFESLTDKNPYAICINAAATQSNDAWQIKLFKLNDQVSLSTSLPLIENFGFILLHEHPYELVTKDGHKIYICDFMVNASNIHRDLFKDNRTTDTLQQAMISAFNHEVENDILNKLVLYAGLSIHQVSLLRALTHYLVQTTLFSKQYLTDCLTLHYEVACFLFHMFSAKFNVTKQNKKDIHMYRNKILKYLEQVSSLDEDRILRAYVAIIDAMLRTNYYQADANGERKKYISFKLKSGQLTFLPKPHPLYEIFVYSKRFEAIHLRGGTVARGGLRWSDRMEDFRTEVLGLMKAQVVKNSIIVPTGSKGGFVCKMLPLFTDRDAYTSEGIACYKSFICGLLDITDNLIMGQTVPPKDVICYDAADPYLVVAADKGTASFSDYANQVSADYGFWLGDAFASGGSAGYDHKKMGITARGAWESAKRHFRHLGIDTQKEDFTVIGIGDMSGDVFGNAMLLSEHICLIAAFNHQHIFIDPKPNPATSFMERQRLFNLPGSSWTDYDITKISTGGGVYSRSAKSVTLSNEVKEWLKVTDDTLTPNELINLILKAKADMLYNGGIGTYFKAEFESNEQVRDRANDAIRVNGNQLKVKVFVEGGNLGATQLGRVEFAKNGGLLYTDAVDNSAGVDCSDHEVNIKILFADVMQKTSMDVLQRNKVLESMTNEIAHLVLRDNYLQTEILQYAHARAVELFSINVNFVERLEKRGELDRAVEFLPNQHEIAERQRAGVGLTLPELSVLLAYSKMLLKRDILASNIVDTGLFDSLLISYFPKYLQTHYKDSIENHYLHKEIIATQLTNLVVNRMGITFVSRFQEELRISIAEIVRAFWLVFKLVDAEKIFAEIEALDNKIDASTQVEMIIRIKKSLERMTRWVLRNIKEDDLDVVKFFDLYGTGVKQLFNILPTLLQKTEYTTMGESEDYFVANNVPDQLAKIIARSNYIPQTLEIVLLAAETGHDLESIAHNYFYLGRLLRIDWLRRSLIALPENNKWQALARSALLSDGYKLYGQFVRQAISHASAKNDMRFASNWMSAEPEKVKEINLMFDELQGYKVLDLAMLSAVVRELGNIVK